MEGNTQSVPADLPGTDAIRELTNRVLSGPDFRLDQAGDDPYGFGWRLTEFIRKIFRPIMEFFDNLNQVSPVLWWLTVIGLFLLLVLLTGHIVYSFRAALRSGRTFSNERAKDENPLDQPETWEARAEEARAKGDFIGALRHLFRAGLIRLERSRERTFRSGTTNREYLMRYRQSSAYSPLQLFVEMVDRKWYGEEACSAADFQAGQQAYQQIRASVGGSHRARNA